MDISKEGLAELAAYEAIILKPYLDSVGVKTVGVGSTKSDIPDIALWAWDREITIKEAIDIYKKGLKKYVDAVNAALKVPVKQHEFDALVSITYNIGTGGMRGSTFMKLVNSKASPAQIVSAMQRFNRAGGRVLKGLVNRRKAESELYLTGKYAHNGKVSVVPVSASHQPIYKNAKSIDIRPFL